MKINLHIAILKRKQKNHDINLKRLSIKMLQTTLLTMLVNKNLKISQNSITKNVSIS